jgi:hypothetical protein
MENDWMDWKFATESYEYWKSILDHKHLGKEEYVTESPPMKLEMVLEYIREKLKC